MLIFVDQPKAIKVFRTEDGENGAVTRERLGSIPKNKMELPDDIKEALKGDELSEVESVLSMYQQADKAQTRANVLKYPQITREVVEYLSSGEADAAETRMLIASIVDAVRVIRKLKKTGSE